MSKPIKEVYGHFHGMWSVRKVMKSLKITSILQQRRVVFPHCQVEMVAFLCIPKLVLFYLSTTVILISIK